MNKKNFGELQPGDRFRYNCCTWRKVKAIRGRIVFGNFLKDASGDFVINALMYEEPDWNAVNFKDHVQVEVWDYEGFPVASRDEFRIYKRYRK